MKIKKIKKRNYNNEINNNNKKIDNNYDNNNIDNNDNNNNKSNKNGDIYQLEKRFSRKNDDFIKKRELSEQKLYYLKKKKTFFNFINTNSDFNQKKLISKSKLINMYYEVKDKSNQNEDINDLKNEKLINEKNKKENMVFK